MIASKDLLDGTFLKLVVDVRWRERRVPEGGVPGSTWGSRSSFLPSSVILVVFLYSEEAATDFSPRPRRSSNNLQR